MVMFSVVDFNDRHDLLHTWTSAVWPWVSKWFHSPAKLSVSDLNAPILFSERHVMLWCGKRQMSRDDCAVRYGIPLTKVTGRPAE
jgi:hypothetical protein